MLQITIQTDEIICDLCCEDYTESEAKGGLIQDNWAICPKCETNWKDTSSHHFKDDNLTFKQLVLEFRESLKQEDIF